MNNNSSCWSDRGFCADRMLARPSSTALQPVAFGLRSNDRSLNARQKLLRFGQGQSQVSNITKTFRPADLYQIGAQAAGITLRRNQPQHPSHPRSPGRLSTDRPYPLCRHTPIRWTLPAACDVEGAGNVARPRWCDTRRRKSEPTGNTNFGLNRRVSPRPYR